MEGPALERPTSRRSLKIKFFVIDKPANNRSSVLGRYASTNLLSFMISIMVNALTMTIKHATGKPRCPNRRHILDRYLSTKQIPVIINAKIALNIEPSTNALDQFNEVCRRRFGRAMFNPNQSQPPEL